MEFINADVVRKEVATVAELKAVGGLVKGQLGFATDDGVMVRRNQDDSFTEWESEPVTNVGKITDVDDFQTQLDSGVTTFILDSSYFRTMYFSGTYDIPDGNLRIICPTLTHGLHLAGNTIFRFPATSESPEKLIIEGTLNLSKNLTIENEETSSEIDALVVTHNPIISCGNTIFISKITLESDLYLTENTVIKYEELISNGYNVFVEGTTTPVYTYQEFWKTPQDSTKQNTLTAGDGIAIDGNAVISATGDERLEHFWSSTDVSGFDAELTGGDGIIFQAGVAYIKDETTGKIVKVETTSAETIALGSYGTFYCYLSLDGLWRATTNRSIFLNHEVSIMYVTTLTEETFTILDVRHQAVDFPHASNLKSVYVDGYKKGLGANLTVDNLGVNLKVSFGLFFLINKSLHSFGLDTTTTPTAPVIGSFRSVYYDTVNWNYSSDTVIGYNKYNDVLDNVTPLKPISNNKYGNFWLAVQFDQTGSVRYFLQYGQGSYATEDDASNAPLPTLVAPELEPFGTCHFTHQIIFKGDGVLAKILDLDLTGTKASSSTGVEDHQLLSDLQGGNATERYHLTVAELTKLQNGETLAEVLANGSDAGEQEINNLNGLDINVTNLPEGERGFSIWKLVGGVKEYFVGFKDGFFSALKGSFAYLESANAIFVEFKSVVKGAVGYAIEEPVPMSATFSAKGSAGGSSGFTVVGSTGGTPNIDGDYEVQVGTRHGEPWYKHTTLNLWLMRVLDYGGASTALNYGIVTEDSLTIDQWDSSRCNYSQRGGLDGTPSAETFAGNFPYTGNVGASSYSPDAKNAIHADGTILINATEEEIRAVADDKGAVTVEMLGGYVSGLIPVDEGNGVGFHLKGDDRANKGNLGLNATDLSYSNSASTTRGATGDYSHAEGSVTEARGDVSHAEGRLAKAIGSYSHAEGYATETGGQSSHAEGSSTRASGNFSHSEGIDTGAGGQSSHAEGNNTNIGSEAPKGAHVEGQYSLDVTTDQQSVIGIGTSTSARKNGRVMWSDGTMELPEATKTKNEARGANAVVIQGQLDGVSKFDVSTDSELQTALLNSDCEAKIIICNIENNAPSLFIDGDVYGEIELIGEVRVINVRGISPNGNSLKGTSLVTGSTNQDTTITADNISVDFYRVFGGTTTLSALNGASIKYRENFTTISVVGGEMVSSIRNGISTNLKTSNTVAENIANDDNLASIGGVKELMPSTNYSDDVSWVQVGSSNIYYKLYRGVVYLKGYAKKGETIGALPTTRRPHGVSHYSIANNTTGPYGSNLSILGNGTLYITSGVENVSYFVDNVSFIQEN